MTKVLANEHKRATLVSSVFLQALPCSPYRETEVFSVTSTIAAMSVFALGGLAVAGDFRAAVAGEAAVACILASREVLHGLLKRLSWNEVRSTLTLAAMTAIGLPLLPNHPIDPWEGSTHSRYGF